MTRPKMPLSKALDLRVLLCICLETGGTPVGMTSDQWVIVGSLLCECANVNLDDRAEEKERERKRHALQNILLDKEVPNI